MVRGGGKVWSDHPLVIVDDADQDSSRLTSSDVDGRGVTNSAVPRLIYYSSSFCLSTNFVKKLQSIKLRSPFIKYFFSPNVFLTSFIIWRGPRNINT
ncbi:unnamed protein product, partial [Callosobruchus maculatus]